MIDNLTSFLQKYTNNELEQDAIIETIHQLHQTLMSELTTKGELPPFEALLLYKAIKQYDIKFQVQEILPLFRQHFLETFETLHSTKKEKIIYNNLV